VVMFVTTKARLSLEQAGRAQRPLNQVSVAGMIELLVPCMKTWIRSLGLRHAACSLAATATTVFWHSGDTLLHVGEWLDPYCRLYCVWQMDKLGLSKCAGDNRNKE